jgi:class 3 adenylate cyclase
MSEDEKPFTLEEWSRAQNLSLSLVFTDIVESTTIGISLGDAKWIEALFEHFSTARSMALIYDCFVVKAIGDSLMIAFRRPSEAVQFAVRFAEHTGVDYIGIRVGIHAGEVEIRENDIYGLTVNRASRVQHALKREGIYVTRVVKDDYENRFGTNSDVRFHPRDEPLKSFGSETVYLLHTGTYMRARRRQKNARADLLNSRRLRAGMPNEKESSR